MKLLQFRHSRNCSLGLLVVLTVGCRSESKHPGGSWDSGVVFSSTTTKLTHDYRITNTTGIPVRILGEEHSCGCTSVALKKGVLLPGEVTIAVMEVNLPRERERGAVGFSVITDHPNWPKWEYTATFESVPFAKFEPAALNFGTVRTASKPGQTNGPIVARAHLEVYGPGSAGALSTPIRLVTPPELLAEIDELAILDNPRPGVLRARYPVKVTLAESPQSLGTFYRPIKADFGGRKSVELRVIWQATGAVTFTPSHVHFGLIKLADEPVTRTVVIHGENKRAFRLLKVEASSPLLSFEASATTAGSSSSHVLMIKFKPPSEKSGPALNGYVKIQADIGGAPEIKIPWSAFLLGSSQANRL